MSEGRSTPSLAGHPQRIGHYRLLEVLGSGVLTTVYRAEAEGIARVVALKVLRSSAGRESAFFRRFEREARLLSSLRHPNLIELFDFDMGVTGERPPYMVLEHVAGATLAEVLLRGKRLEPDEAAALSLEIARALAYAHRRGVVHRDVKPGNVLIGRVASSAASAVEAIAVKLVDFGIAADSPRTMDDGGLDGSSDGNGNDSAESLGTPAYMAPEQLLGELVDHRADHFALGIVLYQMLAGVRPFDGDDGRPAIQRVRRDPPKAFRALGLTVPRALERIVLRCLAKRPADRFESTDEIVDELTQFLDGRVESLNDLSPLLLRVLSRAGLVEERRGLREEGPETNRPVRVAPIRVRAVPLSPTVAGLAFAMVALLVGGGVIQFRSGGIRSGKTVSEPAKPTAAEASDTGRLRVMVRPWADVLIDGVKVETTPISRALRLRPGKHVITFVHPSATEKRIVQIEAGQTLTLDVVMNVPMPAYPDEFLLPEPSSSPPPTPSSSKGTPFGASTTLAPR